MIARVAFLVLLLAGAAAAGFLLLRSPGAAAGPEEERTAAFAGPRKCQACHLERHRRWVESAHSRAGASLTAEQIRKGVDFRGRACAECHVTGWKKPSGFRSGAETPELGNVGCEACHGPASEHIWVMTKAKVDGTEPADRKIGRSEDCSTCHNPHLSYRKLYGAKKD